MRVRLLALFAVASLCASAYAVAAGEESLPARAAAPERAVVRTPACPLPAVFRGGFEAAAAETRVPLALLVAVAERESGLRPDAVSSAGARGLLQLMPATAADVSVEADHPDSNVLGGARYLRTLLDRFASPELALAAYNAGPTAVARAGGAPTSETLTYVADVTARWRALDGCR
jgi:soluble lytic murein transglycosylase-like protein